MDEYISREATIDAIKKIYCPQCNNYNGVKDGKEVEYSFDVTPFEYSRYAIGDWYPKE
jgi:hypothetical protein